jgi:hypothetical protein
MGCITSSATADISSPGGQARSPGGGGPGGGGVPTPSSPNRQNQQQLQMQQQQQPATTTHWRMGTGPARPSQPTETPAPETFASQAELDAQREDFWGSRSDGDALVWMTLRRAAEACIEGDFGLSGAILLAGDINTPSGVLELCYDDRGREYRLPPYCYLHSCDLVVSKAASAAAEAVAMAEASEPPVRKGPPGAELRLKVCCDIYIY